MILSLSVKKEEEGAGAFWSFCSQRWWRQHPQRNSTIFFIQVHTRLLAEDIYVLDVAVVLVFSIVFTALEFWVILGSWESGDSSFPTPDIIFTPVTQNRLLLPCLTFWCGTNSQQPTASPSSAKAVCILSSLPPCIIPVFLVITLICLLCYPAALHSCQGKVVQQN